MLSNEVSVKADASKRHQVCSYIVVHIRDNPNMEVNYLMSLNPHLIEMKLTYCSNGLNYSLTETFAITCSQDNVKASHYY